MREQAVQAVIDSLARDPEDWSTYKEAGQVYNDKHAIGIDVSEAERAWIAFTKGANGQPTKLALSLEQATKLQSAVEKWRALVGDGVAAEIIRRLK